MKNDAKGELLEILRFEACLRYCLGERELVEGFDRLTNSNLSMRGSALDIEIDKATGRIEKEFQEFADFVREFVYNRQDPKVFDALILAYNRSQADGQGQIR